jgi:hypothetical protein
MGVAVAVVAACSPGGDTAGAGRPRAPGGRVRVGLDSPSLSAAGRRLAAKAGLDRAPSYDLGAVVQPDTGKVEGSLVADLPLPAGDENLRFRVFPDLPGLATGFRLGRVEVGGHRVPPALDRALLTLPCPPVAGAARTEVRLEFSYTVGVTKASADPLPALGGGSSLQPADIGLLGRHDGGLALGHWFPVAIAPGGSDDPDPAGFGDIANFPAAVISARVDVPAGWKLFGGGVTTDRRTGRGRTVYSEQGVGLRDLSVYVGRDLDVREEKAGDVTVRVVSQPADAKAAADVAYEATGALTALAEAFGPYPWSELDVVDVPLGSGIGGMEWPGAVWIAQSFFGGGVPGLGGLEDLGGLSGLTDVLGGAGGLGVVLDLDALGSLRPFVVAHEIGHEWWHALVGNDSIVAPVLDEPLAQFSACVVFRARAPATAADVCTFNTATQYTTLRALGDPDTRADQPITGFASSRHYGAVVYGKAPGFYERLRSAIGDEASLAALRRYADANAFGVATPEILRASLRSAASGRAAEIDALWDRWMEQAHGDEDLGVVSGPGGAELGPLGDLLQELLGHD